jgi:feruloyl esterase
MRVWILTLALGLVPFVADAGTCDSVVSLTLLHGRVTAASEVAAGAFAPPAGTRAGGPGGANVFASLPAFCRVSASLKSAPRSEIRLEVWLPASGWNGRLQVVGNGNFAGTISYPAMASALAAGYATASTDTGHQGPPKNTFVNNDLLLDFASRAIHQTTIAAKAIVNAFYGNAQMFAYFNGCSTGGRQALTEAQRFPNDFDGIVAGAPASYTSKQAFGQIWIYQATAAPGAALPEDRLEVLHQAVLQACDGRDGVRDGVIENPLTCGFDPRTIACKPGSDPSSCLTPAQADAAAKIYAGASNPRTGEFIFPGFERGSEAAWTPVPVSYAVDYFTYIVYGNPDWDPKRLNFDSDLDVAAKAKSARILDATNADLSRFTAHRGKLLMYQGWADQGIPPRNIVTYFSEVQKATKNAKASVRLFMVPGMGHCGGGDGTSTFDMASALDAWVTSGQAPQRIPAARVRNGVTDRTRPLCPWPQIATYTGTGSTDDEKNFVCR